MPGQDWEASKRKALRIKPCWTEPLVTRANVASSMGIVKMEALETKLVQAHQVSGLKGSAGRTVGGMRVHGEIERRRGHKEVCQRSKIWVASRPGHRPETAGQKSTVMRDAGCR